MSALLTRPQSDGSDARQRTPSFEMTTKIVARALGLSTRDLFEAFIPAKAEHLAGVVELRRRTCGLSTTWDDSAYLDWRYSFGSSVKGRGTCWVLVHRDRVIGMVGTENIELVDDDGVMPAISTMDLAVDAEFADSGLGIWMNMRLCGGVPLAITIGSNAQSVSIVSRYFRRIPDRRSYVYPIDLRRYLAKTITLPWIGTLLGSGLNVMMSMWRIVALRGSNELEIRRIARFDAAFQPLIDQARHAGELHIRKSLGFLNWRLFESPRSKYIVWGAYQAGRPVGSIAILEQSIDRSMTQVEMVDWLLATADERKIFRNLCREVIVHAAKLKSDRVVVTAYHGRSERLLRSFGFVRRVSKFETIGIAGSDLAQVARATQNKNWCVTEINTDRDGV